MGHKGRQSSLPIRGVVFFLKKITVKESAEKLMILEDMEYLDTKSFGSSIVKKDTTCLILSIILHERLGNHQCATQNLDTKCMLVTGA